jgi:hypothetical protein
MIDVSVLDEPLLEFGYSATHPEQRAGIIAHGPADIEMEGRCERIRLGLVGEVKAVEEVQGYLKTCAGGVDAKTSELRELFPEFPGCRSKVGFCARVAFPKNARRAMSHSLLKSLAGAADDQERIRVGVELCAQEVNRLLEYAEVDVVVVARPSGIPDGVGDRERVGRNFHDLLKATLIATPTPIQIIRPITWKGGAGVEDPATRAWNLFSALFYKAGGKPWRLHTSRSEPTRCFVGVSFTRMRAGGELFASVAQVFNELGEGVIVRGGLAAQGEHDRQPHLSRDDAEALLRDALERYRAVHGNLPATLTLHKTSSFSEEEVAGFLAAAQIGPLACELVWLTSSDEAIVMREARTYPPLRGTLASLSDEEHLLYTHGSVPYYRTYPGLYIPRPLGLRPRLIERPVQEVAREILSLTKLNWNRARMGARLPITLLTARSVGEILRHVPNSVPAASQYAKYM